MRGAEDLMCWWMPWLSCWRVRRSWTCVLRSRRRPQQISLWDNKGFGPVYLFLCVGGGRACLSQLGRAGILCGMRDCGRVVEEETVLGGECVDSCMIYIEERCVKGLFYGSGE